MSRFRPPLTSAEPASRGGGPTGVCLAVVAALLLAVLTAAPEAAAWEIRSDAPEASFRLFHERFASAVYHYPRHGAKPLGIIGFEAYADVAVDRGFDDEPFFRDVVSGDLPADTLGVARIGARKGLPGNFDVGVAYGRALDGDLELISGDLQWALLDGGAVSPALSFRLTGTQNIDSGAYQLEQYGAEAFISKGFAILTPYAGVGYVWDEGTLDRGDGTRVSHDDSRFVAYGGVVLNLLLPKIVVEVESADHVQGAVRLAFGF